LCRFHAIKDSIETVCPSLPQNGLGIAMFTEWFDNVAELS
jgi:hypothetical protein